MTIEYSAFFQPELGWVGDVIPVAVDGAFWLFYLLERRDDPKPGTPWALAVTKDLVRFDDRGISFECGGPDDPDFNAYTGSVVRDDANVFHLFYTAQNPERLGADGLPLQVVRRATSADEMGTWVRDAAWELGAPAGYETADWRDPFVFYDDQAGLWRMVLAGRHQEGPDRRRGVLAQFTSTDLVDWTLTEPFWDPHRFLMHECPDVFAWGDWWYLVFSEFSETFTTRYRVGTSPTGPWTVPDHDTVDGRAFYAAKSAARGDRRFFFGWIASKEGNCDAGAWQWAGTLSTLEAHQNDDGSLRFGLPAELVEGFNRDVPVIDIPTPLVLDAPDGYAAVVSTVAAPVTGYLRVAFDITDGTTEAGVLLRASADGDEGYVVRLEPRRHRMVLDRWPRASTGPMQWQISGDVPFELERPCTLPVGEHVLEVVLDHDLLVAVVDGAVSLSARIYDRNAGQVGVFVGEGRATVTDLSLRVRADS